MNTINPTKKRKVLIESQKIITQDNDGIKRYQIELLKALLPIVDRPDSGWEIDLYIHGEIYPLKDCEHIIQEQFLKKPLGNNSSSAAALSSSEHQIIAKIRSYLKLFFASNDHLFLNFVFKLQWQVRAIFQSLLLSVKHKYKSSTIPLSSYDLIHIPLPQHCSPFKRAKTKLLVTVHDLTHIITPKYHTQGNIEKAKIGINDAIDKKADFIAISQSTKNDMLQHLAIQKDKVHLVYEAADPDKFNPKTDQRHCHSALKKYGINPQQAYIICLSTIEPRKNLKNTIAAYVKFKEERPDSPLKLVIAGKKGWHFNEVFEAAEAHSDNIIFTGFVDDADLAYLYSSAIAMSYLSFYEGFGLPPLEAMSCSTPVIFGNNSSLIEVVGDGGLPADPHNIEDIMNQYKKIFFDTELRHTKREMARVQAQKFSWHDTAVDTLNVYKKTIDASNDY